MNIKRFFIISLAVIILGYAVGSAVADQPLPGSDADPIVTKSYVDNYINSAISGLQQEIDKLKVQVAELEEKVKGQKSVKKETITLRIGSKTAFVGENEVQLDAAPYLHNGTTMLPFAFIGEALGAKVGWVGETKTVSFESGQNRIELQIGSKAALVNGTIVELDAPPVIKSNRTLVPLRFVSENLGAKVEWVKETKTIKITP